MTQWPCPHGVPPDLSLMLGRLLERSEATVHSLDNIDRRLSSSEQATTGRLDRIDRRLERGDARMTGLSQRIAAIETRKAGIPTWERTVKAALPYLIGLGTLWGTGSIDVATRVINALMGGR